jgi:hypothetical protein
MTAMVLIQGCMVASNQVFWVDKKVRVTVIETKN